MRKGKKRRVLLNAMRAAIITPPNIVWQLRDRFSIDDAAPVADPLPADFLGGWDVVDTGSNLDVASGVLQINGRAGAGDPRLNARDASGSPTWTRAAGLAAFYRVLTPAAADGHTRVGWDNSATSSPVYQAVRILSTGALQILAGTALVQVNPTALTDDVNYDYAFVCREAGGHWFARGGTQYPDWTLIWVNGALNATPIYLAIAPASGGMTRGLDTEMVSIVQLEGALASDFGIVTDRLAGARSAGDIFTHTADCFIEFVQTTVPSALQTELAFREQDTSNRWEITDDSSGDLNLDEVVAGVPTQRGIAAAAIADGERVSVSAVDTNIQASDEAGRHINYTSATKFKNETMGRLITEGTGGAVDDIITWPARGHNFDKYFKGA